MTDLDKGASDSVRHTFRAHQLLIDGRSAFVEDWGDLSSTPLLALHTAGQSGVQYRDVAPRLAEVGYRVIVPDLPGHGRSEPCAGDPVTDLGDYAQFALSVIDLLGIEKFSVVGCSIGGKITIDLVTRAGSRIYAAVAMAAGAGSGRVSVRSLKRELVDIAAPSRTERTYWGTDAVVGKSVSADRRNMIARMHCREDPIVSNSDLIGWGNHDVRGLLSDISCPVRLVVGSDDLWIDSDEVRRDASSIPRGHFELIDGIGHYPMEEMPDFADFVDTWLRSDQSAGADKEAQIA
ncbi:alpha/beta fold hydrolase [Brevibacterium atlanticum]|uniref:alpha/beta fold hydrolase n=1 Tax=Brevibacterium atlanticum TaxID=2697563 RepID=UPI00141FE77B|nr:alpha/beta hydrolase [Brevibacterium atlanticum]